jgi:3-oxoacyl-[acyl-carrier-protein] synthase III
MEPRSVRITGWGSYAPETVLSNAMLETLVDTSDEWIRTRTGIRERRIAAPWESTATLAAIAGKRALAVSGLEPEAIDLLIVATCTPDTSIPSTASYASEAMGTRRAAVLDVNAACSGFVYGYATAHAYVSSGMYRHVMVVGAEVMSRILDFTDRNTCVLFGDGAGAIVLSASDEAGGGLLGVELTADPEGAYRIWVPAGGSRDPPRRGRSSGAATSSGWMAARRTSTRRGRLRPPVSRRCRGPASRPTTSHCSCRTRRTCGSSSRSRSSCRCRWTACT